MVDRVDGRSMIELRRRRWRDVAARLIPRVRRRQDAELAAAVRALVDDPDLPCVIEGVVIPNGKGRSMTEDALGVGLLLIALALLFLPCRYDPAIILKEWLERPPADPYRDDRVAPRACNYCGRLYRGPAVYCSLKCALDDA